jgi:hypothetical protein
MRSIRAITNLSGKAKNFPLNKFSNHSLKSYTYPATTASLSHISNSNPLNPKQATLTNADLKNCFHILKYLYDCQHPSTGSSSGVNVANGFGVFGIDDVYQKLKAYRLNLLHMDVLRNPLKYHSSDDSNTNSKYYLATFDLEKCFDEVDTIQLYSIVTNLINSHGNNKASINEDTILSNAAKSSSLSTVICEGDTSRAIEDISFFVYKYYITYNVQSLEKNITKCVYYVSEDDNITTFQGTYILHV